MLFFTVFKIKIGIGYLFPFFYFFYNFLPTSPPPPPHGAFFLSIKWTIPRSLVYLPSLNFSFSFSKEFPHLLLVSNFILYCTSVLLQKADFNFFTV